MIKHIVMWKVKDGVDGRSKLESAKLFKEKTEKLKDEIKEIINIEVGINIVDGDCAHDIVLYSEFASLEDLEIYQKHPAHLKLIEFSSGLVESRVVVDYQV